MALASIEIDVTEHDETRTLTFYLRNEGGYLWMCDPGIFDPDNRHRQCFRSRRRSGTATAMTATSDTLQKEAMKVARRYDSKAKAPKADDRREA